MPITLSSIHEFLNRSTWFKIRNQEYSQWAGRDELFESREEQQRPGWDVCSKAAGAAIGI
jgi:hypothetical protein